uniref:SLC26A/SulP transporter domain-containing protein n=1 Tax=Panagrolaimus sp. JU765 TaxID=591449 RepID=A0AC34R072_9BILA
MSEDADGGPDVYEASYDFPPPYSVNGTRHPMNQEEFDAKYGYHRPDHRHGIVTRRCIKLTRRYWKPFTSPKNFLSTVISFFPILRWLPKYDWKRNLTYDFLGGLTVGVMHVPQSIAYALLAKVPPVVGLYTSLFPALLYMLFGTSMHNSIGSFAVVSLMAGKSVTKLCHEPLIDGDNGTLEDGLQD